MPRIFNPGDNTDEQEQNNILEMAFDTLESTTESIQLPERVADGGGFDYHEAETTPDIADHTGSASEQQAADNAGHEDGEVEQQAPDMNGNGDGEEDRQAPDIAEHKRNDAEQQESHKTLDTNDEAPDSEDGEGSDIEEHVVQLTEQSLSDGDTLYIVSVNVQKKNSEIYRRSQYCYFRQIETIIFGAAGYSTSSLHKLLESMELEECTLRIDKKCSRIKPTSLAEILEVYNDHLRDPLSNKARHVTLISKKVVGQIAHARRHESLLKAVGRKIPQAWIKEAQLQSDQEQKKRDDAVGDVDLNLHQRIQDNKKLLQDDLDEMLHINLFDEMDMVYEDFIDEDNDAEQLPTGRNYTLQDPSQEMISQLEAYDAYRTSTLNRYREGRKVVGITSDNDKKVIVGNLTLLWTSVLSDKSFKIHC